MPYYGSGKLGKNIEKNKNFLDQRNSDIIKLYEERRNNNDIKNEKTLELKNNNVNIYNIKYNNEK